MKPALTADYRRKVGALVRRNITLLDEMLAKSSDRTEVLVMIVQALAGGMDRSISLASRPEHFTPRHLPRFQNWPQEVRETWLFFTESIVGFCEQDEVLKVCDAVQYEAILAEHLVPVAQLLTESYTAERNRQLFQGHIARPRE